LFLLLPQLWHQPRRQALLSPSFLQLLLLLVLLPLLLPSLLLLLYQLTLLLLQVLLMLFPQELTVPPHKLLLLGSLNTPRPCMPQQTHRRFRRHLRRPETQCSRQHIPSLILLLQLLSLLPVLLLVLLLLI